MRVLLAGALLGAITSCRAPAPAPAAPAAPVVRVRGCVTVDASPATDASVLAVSAGVQASPEPLDARGCFALERPVGGVGWLLVTAPGRGSIRQTVPPIAGELDLGFSLPTEGRTAAATVRGRDRMSRLAAVAGWYSAELRGEPTREHLQAVLERQRAETDPIVREAYGLLYLVLARTPGAPADAIDPGRVREAVAALSPTHVAWSVEMEAIVMAAMAGDIGPDQLRRVLDAHPDPFVVGAAAYALAEKQLAAGERAELRATLARLRARGVKGPFADFALALDPDDTVAEGKPLPAFALRTLAGDGVLESSALRGKVVVLHFWATWCQPCVEQIPRLAELHARHAAAGLEIVSVAIDEDPRTVAEFRRTRAPMPWQHAWEPPEVTEALRATYQVESSTKTILVGRDGVVVSEHLHAGDPAFASQVAAALAAR